MGGRPGGMVISSEILLEVGGAIFPTFVELCLILQRTLAEFIEPRYAALAMGTIGRVIPLLPVSHEVEHCRGIEDAPGQDTP
jgi:hypothetical protein